MSISQNIRAGVINSLPEIENIQDVDLREKVIDAWVLALRETTYHTLEEMPCSGNPGGVKIASHSQAAHIRGVARISVALLDSLEGLFGNLRVDRDLLLAAALCHDVGKPYEYDPPNQERWKSDEHESGRPALRHPLYGAHLALNVGLPEEVVHTCAAHSHEGEYVSRSLIATIVHRADYDFWYIMRKTHVVPVD